jgi:hypothetical protein
LRRRGVSIHREMGLHENALVGVAVWWCMMCMMARAAARINRF